MASSGAIIKHAWNASVNEDPKRRTYSYEDYGASYSVRPDRPRLHLSNERSIISSIYTRLSVDIASAFRMDMAKTLRDVAMVVGD